MIRASLNLLTGSTLGAGFTYLAIAFLGRNAQPEEFATFGLVAAIAAWISFVGAARYEAAIPVPKGKGTAVALTQLALLLQLSVLLIGLAVALVASSFELSAGEPVGIAPWLWTIPVLAFSLGSVQILEVWLNRSQEYKLLGMSRSIRGVSTAFSQLAIYWSTDEVLPALILGLLLGTFLGLLVAARWSNFWPLSFGAFKPKRLKLVAKRYSDYPKFNAIHGAIHASQEPVTLLLLTGLGGAAAAGSYAFMMRTIGAPMGLIAGALAPVLLRKLALGASDRKQTIKKVMALSTSLAILPFLVLTLRGDELFEFVFGQQWTTSGKMATAISGYLMLGFIASPLAVIPQVLRKMRTALLLSVLGNVLFLGTLTTMLWLYEDPIIAFWSISAVFVLYFVSLFRWYLRIGHNPTPQQ